MVTEQQRIIAAVELYLESEYYWLWARQRAEHPQCRCVVVLMEQQRVLVPAPKVDWINYALAALALFMATFALLIAR